MRPGYLRNFGDIAILTSSGQLDCGANKPSNTPDFFYQCCPLGWTAVKYGDTDGCKAQKQLQLDLIACGNKPNVQLGMDEALVCCPEKGGWVKTNMRSPIACNRASGTAGPRQSLASDIDINLITQAHNVFPVDPKLLLAAGIGLMAITVITAII